MAMAVAAALMTGCSVEDAVSDISSGSVGGGSGSGNDSFTIQKQGSDFVINWNKNYNGYSEIIYTDGSTGARGNGYPFTNNATGNYTLTCSLFGENNRKVYYHCVRPDITATSRVTLEKGVEYQWLVSYGTEHEHGETEAVMEYVGGTLSIQ